MITRKTTFYQGLDTLDVDVLDTSPLSSNYLRLFKVPEELTAGKNSFYIQGNKNAFKKDTSIFIEVLDAQRNVVYSNIPDYYDSLKRRMIVIEVTDEHIYGQGIITIVGTLKDEFVSPGWEGTPNYKWQKEIIISPFKSNNSDIIYSVPPKIELNTKVRPFVTKSYRNSDETITYEYGGFAYNDSNFKNYIGDVDNSSEIYQLHTMDKLLVSYAEGPSITGFRRKNVFYYPEENYTAKVKSFNNPHFTAKSFGFNSDMIGGLVTVHDAININPPIPSTYNLVDLDKNILPSSSMNSYVDYVLNTKYAGTINSFDINIAKKSSTNNFTNYLSNAYTVKGFGSGIITGSLSVNVRCDWTSSLWALQREAGHIYHFNTVMPAPVGTIAYLDASTEYLIVDLNLYDLDPISGDVSKIQVSVKPKSDVTNYTDLGIYNLKSTEILTDNNFVNSVQYLDEIYRPIGYFKPIILGNYTSSIVESSSFTTNLNYGDSSSWDSSSFMGWLTTSDTQYHPYVTSSGFQVTITGSQNQYITFTKGKLAFTPSNLAGRNYLVYKGEKLPKVTGSRDTSFLISAFIYARDTGSFFPAGQSQIDALTGPVLTPMRVKPAIFVSSSTYVAFSNFEEFTQSASPGYLDDSVNGPFSSSAQYSKYFTSAGWISHEIIVPAGVDNLYGGLIIDNPYDDQTDNGQAVTIGEMRFREIGTRDYIMNTYWTASMIDPSYHYSGSIANITSSIPITQSNSDVLMDSACIYVSKSRTRDNSYTSSVGTDRVLFRPNDWFKFYKGTTYEVKFNAAARRSNNTFVVDAQSGNRMSNPSMNPPYANPFTGNPAATTDNKPSYWDDVGKSTQLNSPFIIGTSSNGTGNLKMASYRLTTAGTLPYTDIELAIINKHDQPFWLGGQAWRYEANVSAGDKFIGDITLALYSGSGSTEEVLIADSGDPLQSAHPFGIRVDMGGLTGGAGTTTDIILGDSSGPTAYLTQSGTFNFSFTLESINFNQTNGGPNFTIYALFNIASAGWITGSVLISNVNIYKVESSPGQLPRNASLKVWAINSGSSRPFVSDEFYNLGIEDKGEFVGRLDHNFTETGRTEKKYWREVKMEFKAAETGWGKIGFECNDAAWYLSEISVKPKDDVGFTPNYNKLYLRIPSSLLTQPGSYVDPIWGGNIFTSTASSGTVGVVPLTFKVEYLNDSNIKSDYETIVRDIKFSNTNKQISTNKGSAKNDIGEDPT